MEQLVTKTYILNFSNVKGNTIVYYNAEGLFSGLQVQAEYTPQQLEYLLKTLPIMESNLSIFEYGLKGKLKVERAQDDLTFERFWTLYNYKVGKKERTKKLWEALSEADKIVCLNSIPKYNKWLSTRTTARLYAETYLSQERFNNEF